MTSPTDDLQAVRRVADAVLYEGYLLYPYRASSSKNQVRWQFGVIGPVGAEAAGVGEDSSMYTECLLQPTVGHLQLDVILRFLQVQWRSVERCVDAAREQFEPVDELRAGAARWIPWHEAVEREIPLDGLGFDAAVAGHVLDVLVPGGEEIELIRDAEGVVVGRLVRTRWPLAGRLSVGSSPALAEDLHLLRLDFDNLATWQADTSPSAVTARDFAARRSFVGAHLILRAHGGVFLSMVDPPEWATEAARECTNSRCWPILVGACGEQTADCLLGSPIILPEHPAVADESPGDLYDATEIDEILTLRIMTMTDEEKVDARGTDPRAAAIIDRSDDMPPEIFERLHGAIRGYAPSGSFEGSFDDEVPWFSEAADASVAPLSDSVLINGVAVAKGSRVLLRPNRRADAHDMFLIDRTAVVARVDRDVDDVVHVAVLLEDDPASDLHDWYGRYYYFAADELTPLPAREAGRVDAP